MKLSRLNQRRLANFRKKRRAVWSLKIFLLLFFVSLFAEVVANDKPIMLKYNESLYFPVFKSYAETTFGGMFETETDYKDPYISGEINSKGWMIWPPIKFSYESINHNLQQPAPAPPTLTSLLGSDDQGRDVLSRTIYGFRISVLFAFALTSVSILVGIVLGAMQGYFGGLTDLIMQRFIEIWDGMPFLYLLIILASIVKPNFWWLLLLLSLFHWMSISSVVRAEFLRARSLDYVKAARALGLSHFRIMQRHILPNAVVATITYAPFILAGSVVTLTSLDFLGFGLPAGSASLGELLAQGKNNLHAPWLGFTGFFIISFTLSLMIFIGEGVRDAFDPRKSFR